MRNVGGRRDQPHDNPRSGQRTMLQLELETLQTALAPPQELTHRDEQGFECTGEARSLDDFVIELETVDEPLVRYVSTAHIRQATNGPIEFIEQCGTEPPGKTVAGQTQAIAHRSDTHRLQILAAALRPAQAGNR